MKCYVLREESNYPTSSYNEVLGVFKSVESGRVGIETAYADFRKSNDEPVFFDYLEEYNLMETSLTLTSKEDEMFYICWFLEEFELIE